MMYCVFFAEDVWSCLGYPTGAITVARRDLILEEALFTERWRTSLQVSPKSIQFAPFECLHYMISCGQTLQRVCTDNMNLLQQALFHGKRYDKIAERKQRALFRSLYLVEIQHLRSIKELLLPGERGGVVDRQVPGHYFPRTHLAQPIHPVQSERLPRWLPN
jgi:hypothetical protein